MSDFPAQLIRSAPRQVINAGGGVHIGSIDLAESAAAASYPAANRALYFPILIDRFCKITQMWCFNGTVEKGKIDMGIYDEAKNRLVNKGLTTQTGTSTLQLLDITDTTLVPGLYYFAITATSTETTFFRGVINVLKQRAHGVQQQALGAEVELPTTATFANPASTYIPVFGASLSDAAVI